MVIVTAGCGGSSKGPPSVSFYVFNEPGGGFDGAVQQCNKQAAGKYKIDYVRLPTDSDQQRELIVRRLAAKDKSIDVIGMDVNWTAEFAQAGWILPWTGANRAAATEGRVPALLQAVRYKNNIWAAPFTTNTQLLWYHKDVVKGPPPKTWDEMIAQAQKIGGKQGKIVVQGKRYEGLVVWFNTLVASAGGRILDNQGNIGLGPPAVKAATIMRDVAKKAGTPTIANDKEDTGNDAFKSGDLAFMVNYPFVYASIADDKKAIANLGIAPYPSVTPGEPAHVTFGGINLGIGAYSKHKELAFQAAKCLAEPAQQKVAAIKGGLFPTRAALFDDPEIRKTYPFADLVKQALDSGVPRPVLPAYADISLAVQTSLHPPGNIDPENAIKTLRSNLEKAKEGKIF
jgi:multiple sugar transport system substrate-binding protein